MLVLGVDPGSRVTGYGLVEKQNRDLIQVACGQIVGPRNTPFYARIHNIFQQLVDIMAQYQPRQLAVEDVFYARNAKSSLKLGHARGAALIAAVHCGVEVFEYSPLEIKKSVVGYGRATKQQVRTMVQMILKLREKPGLDAADALATAICHLNWSRFESL